MACTDTNCLRHAGNPVVFAAEKYGFDLGALLTERNRVAPEKMALSRLLRSSTKKDLRLAELGVALPRSRADDHKEQG